jgi:peptidoglycan hydrolase FlgJ
MIGSLTSTPPAAAGKPDAELRKAAEAFEAVILRQLIGNMRSAKLSEEMFGSQATAQFRELADARTADTMAEMRAFGIADMVERQLTQAKGLAT